METKTLVRLALLGMMFSLGAALYGATPSKNTKNTSAKSSDSENSSELHEAYTPTSGAMMLIDPCYGSCR